MLECPILWAGLHYSKKVQMVKNFGGMKQYDWLQRGSLAIVVYTTLEISPVETIKHEQKNDRLLRWQHSLLAEFFGGQVS